MKTLCICIPTYNRAVRLRKALNDLREEISVSGKKDSISVYLSDNGSTDDTPSVLKEYAEIFQSMGILFSYDLWPDNEGFDINVMRCYEKCDADYLWLLSDDDNVIRGAVTNIVADINAINPNVIYYNFAQDPFCFDNPLVKEKALYCTFNTSEAIAKIVHWPKLSSIVIKKNEGASGLRVSKLEGIETSGFTHVALALQTVFDNGRLLLSNDFIAFPDADFMDHIDFPPDIFNSLNSMLRSLCESNQKMQLFASLRLRYVSRLNSSLSWLSLFYLGRMMLTPSSKQRLFATVIRELRQASFVKSNQLGFIKGSLTFIAAYAFYRARTIMTGKGGIKIRNENK